MPFTLIPVTWYAYNRGELRALWLGTPSRGAGAVVQLEEAPADQEGLVSAAAPDPHSEPPAATTEGAGTV